MPPLLHADPSLGIPTLLMLVAAGVGTGVVGYLTGLASLISYPAMLAAGLPPVTANVTQTVSLTAIGVGSSTRAFGVVLDTSRRSLLSQVGIAALGGLLGAGLLLAGGEDTFVAIVPWLVLASALVVLVQPALVRWGAGRHHPVLYAVLLALVCVYGGYFGAGAGTMYLAIALIATSQGFARAMVMKSALLAVTKAVSAVFFLVLAPVHLLAALALGIGCLVGGSLGPVVQGWVPEQVLRVAVAVAGVGLAAWLWLAG